jgi:two-component system, sensor histidine kinase and response regulator
MLWRAAPPVALVVDDNPRVRQLVSLLLAQIGLEAIASDDAREVVDLAVRYQPVVIVLDLMLPITDGLTAVANLRRYPETARFPIVLISGHPEALRRAPAQISDLRGIALLRKPFTIAELRAAVSRARRLPLEDVSEGSGSP